MKEPEIEKNFPERHIFVIADNQDLLADEINFTYIEINNRLAQFVSNNVWRSQAAQRLTLNEKIELGKPSKDLMEQCMLEIIDEVSTKMGEQFETAWMMDGQPMKTPLQLPLQCRIMIVSKSEEFAGLKGREHFESRPAATRQNVGGATYVNAQRPTIKVKPQPETWVHMAQVKWVRNNTTDKIPSYSDGGPSDLETQSKIIEAIQEEQNRVHKQDQ